jgi:hypothetical protein
VLAAVAAEYVDDGWSVGDGELAVRKVFIPVPHGLGGSGRFMWDVTTRNFFAFCFGLPLIGYSLSEALVSLHERVTEWTGRDAQEAVAEYLEAAGYRDLTHAPEHALSVLGYAEAFQIEGLWKTAFAHCVGMADALSSAPEFKALLSLLTTIQS